MVNATIVPPPLLELLLDNGRRTARGKESDPVPAVKLFTPDAGATWLLTEVDPADSDRAFGLCDLGLGSPELGYVSLSEIESLRGPLGLPVEVDAHFIGLLPLSAYAKAARAAGRIVEKFAAYPTNAPFHVGQHVFFWTGRGSQGYGVIRAFKGERALIDAEPGAIKGGDFRTFGPGSVRKDVWGPRDHGVRLEQLNTPPKPWYQDS